MTADPPRVEWVPGQQPLPGMPEREPLPIPPYMSWQDDEAWRTWFTHRVVTLWPRREFL